MSGSPGRAGRSNASVLWALAACAWLALPLVCNAADPFTAPVRILVSAFESPEGAPETGAATETALASALTATGLAEPVRPSDPPLSWDRWMTEAWPADAQWVSDRQMGPFRYGLSPAGLRTIASDGMNTEYAMSGKVAKSPDGAALTLQILLKSSYTGEQIATAKASAPDAGALPAAVAEAARTLEPYWVNETLANRVKYALLNIDLIDRDGIVPTLRDWMKRWPDAPAPVLGLYALAAPADRVMAAKEALEYARVIREMVAAGNEDAVQLLRVTGMDPYTPLADAAAAKGSRTEAMAIHREAARVFPDAAYGHLISAAESGIMCRKYPEALAAARDALDLQPDNGFANLLYGILLDRTGKRADAVQHLQAFLATHAGDPAAQQIKTQIEAMQ